MEGCRSPELNPFWTIELITLKTTCKTDFYKGLLIAFIAGNFYFLIRRKANIVRRGR